MIWIPAGAELARLRQALYRFFAGAMLPLDQRRLDEMVAAAELLSRSGIDAFAFAPAWWEVRAELRGPHVLDDLAAMQVRLFEAGTDGALCPPTESFYLASARQGGPALVLADLERDFRRSGIEVVRQGLAADQITPQLELMAVLCRDEAEGRDCGQLDRVANSIDAQRGFLERHLCRWIPPFAARTSQFAPPGLYRAVVAAIAAFIDHDRELLHVMQRADPTGLSV
ncbi:MAG: molecular chaperone TorD family protein [Acidimicrobiia bacterium]|nr:molecular chaperone TorD family protein [Acidimicrobiia bacterium]